MQTATTAASHPSCQKSFKWAPQCFEAVKTGRVQKRASFGSPAFSTRATRNKKMSRLRTCSKVEYLESEIGYTLDSFATITVILDSLRNAYTECKPEMEKSRNPTRLCEREKELLSAYDDLDLQVSHLEKQIDSLEKELNQIRKKGVVSGGDTAHHVTRPEAIVTRDLPATCEQNLWPSPVSFATMDMSAVSPNTTYTNTYSDPLSISDFSGPISFPEEPFSDCYLSHPPTVPMQDCFNFDPSMMMLHESLLQAYNPMFTYANEPALTYTC